MNFMDVLNTKSAEVEKPVPLPQGTYIWKVSKNHKESTSGDGAWFIITIPVVPLSVDAQAEDVDPDALAEFGDLRSGINSIRFMFPTAADADNDRKRTLNQLNNFLINTLRVEADEDSTMKELLAKAIGYEFRGQAVHRQVNDDTFVDVKNWMPLAD